MSAAENDSAHTIACMCLGVVRWAGLAAQTRHQPSLCGEALGTALAFAHDLVDRGVSPTTVRALLTEAL